MIAGKIWYYFLMWGNMDRVPIISNQMFLKNTVFFKYKYCKRELLSDSSVYLSLNSSWIKHSLKLKYEYCPYFLVQIWITVFWKSHKLLNTSPTMLLYSRLQTHVDFRKYLFIVYCSYHACLQHTRKFSEYYTTRKNKLYILAD